jgi:hypothetical protein
MTEDPKGALRALRVLHAEVDEAAARIADRHAGRLECAKGCSDCCVDGQSVFAVEAERIRAEHPALLASGRPHPEGACAFLDGEGACRVYASRPYRCRTQGLPLRWFDEGPEGEPAEYRDVCEKNLTGSPAVDELPGEDCWTLGPAEGRLAELAERFAGTEPGRISLRDLFSVR